MPKGKVAYISYALFVIILAAFIAKGFLPKGVSEELEEGVVSEVEDLLPSGEEGYSKQIRGSCDLIEMGSTCVEYYGSYWNNQTIELACSEGIVSTGGCPAPNMGGCRIMPGSETDMITWHYDRGGDPFSEENILYASQACNSIPGGVWAEED